MSGVPVEPVRGGAVPSPSVRLPLGRRVTVRQRVPDATAASGRPLLTDVVGVVVATGPPTAVLRRRDGALVDVTLADVVAVRLLAAAGPPRRLSGEDLQRVTAEGWPAPVTEPLGEWLLRAAGGFTGRANSASVHGDPGLPFEAALAEVRRFYDRHGLPARAQVVTGTTWDTVFAAAGWQPMGGSHAGVLVLTATVADARTARPTVPPVPVLSTCSQAWLRRYGRVDDPAAARAVLTGGDTVGFAELSGAAEEPATAIGRMVVNGAWAGMACIEVDPAHRGAGLARRVVQTLLNWAAERGARWCWLQTTPDNAAALALYASYGFTRHSAYRCLVPPP